LIRETGFDTEKYLDAQVERILERVSAFDKLYLEFGGKLRFDNHASRVLPGFALDTKVRMLKRLEEEVAIVHCISAKDIERRKIRRDFGLTYDDQIVKDINDLHEVGLDVFAVVINRFGNELTARRFKQKLDNMGIRVFLHYELPQYPKDLDLLLSDEGYGRQDYVDSERKIVVVTAPGPGSGKFSFCMAQLYNDRRQGIMSGFSKFETFPIWNLSLDHPVNVAYEAATADLGDYNAVDPFHRRAYGVEAVNYNRDIENFAITKKIIERMVGEEDPLVQIKSPTDMGVNMTKEGIVDDDVVREASRQEIVRRYFRYRREFVEGDTTIDTVTRMDKIVAKVGVKPEETPVVIAARKAEEEARTEQAETKGYKGVFCGAAIEVHLDSGETIIVTGKNSSLLHAESAAILNAAKRVAGMPDEVDVISLSVIRNLKKLKRIMGLNSTSLDPKMVLDALASSAVSEKNARVCMNALSKLRGCEMHTTHLMTEGNEKTVCQMGLNLTTDAKLPFPEYRPTWSR
jgi:uncharacterized protein (UPF0371 family)